MRSMFEWLQDSPLPKLAEMIKTLHVTSHGCFSGDGDGGADKRCVSEFIKNEVTWKDKLKDAWTSSVKPVINTAAKACFIAKSLRAPHDINANVRSLVKRARTFPRTNRAR